MMSGDTIVRELDIRLILAVVFAVSAIIYGIYCRLKMRQQVKRLDEMLDKAIDGSFTESSFDETQLSYLESKLWKYLSSSEISARKTAEEKDKIKTLIADISHQTKTPVSNIRLYTELLTEENLSPEAQEYAERINNQSEKLTFLITSLVKLSRLETGIITPKPCDSPIAPLLESVISQAKPAAEAKGIEISAEYGEERADFDPKWTAEAVWNIVDNAIKYTDRGSVKIRVKDYEMFLCVEISDTGRGIPENEQAQIFSRFYRSKETSEAEGVGIGLYLARQIISSQNGYIKVSSEIGKGSVFSVFLSKL